jgi:uncharacterized C2H2 Zn-finger protein
MYLKNERALHCNGCGQIFQMSPWSNKYLASHARTKAKSKGWTAARGKGKMFYYCPKCSENRVSAEKEE